MARNYANVATTIWRQDDFRARTAAAQRMYLLLVSQPDISAAGVLPLAIQRWSKRAVDTKPSDVRAALDELQDALFVVYDEDTEELLVRTFVKWDGGYGNPKRRPVIIRAAHDVESPTIRRAIAGEFAKLGLPTDGLTDSQADSLSGSRSMPIPEASTEASAGGESGAGHATAQENEVELYSQANRLSDSDSDTASPSDGVVVTKGPYLETATHNPQTTTPPSVENAPSGAADDAKTKRATRIPADFAITPEMAEWGKTNAPDVHGVRETERFVDYWRAKSGKDATKLDWVATWRNWMRRAQDAARPSNVVALPSTNGALAVRASPAATRPSTADQRFNQAMTLAQRYAEEDNNR